MNSDGFLDMLLTHLRDETNTMYVGRGPKVGFDDVTPASNLVTSSLSLTGFGAAFVDFDHDALLDLVVANGAVQRRSTPFSTRPAYWCDYAEPNQLLHNEGNGRFTALGPESGSFVTELEISRGLIPADFDRDGDLDLFVMNIEGKARLYRNNVDHAAAGASWIEVRLIDSAGRDAVGAMVSLETPTKRMVQPMSTSAGYLTGVIAPLHFGLGRDDVVDRFVVTWPDGAKETFTGGPARRIIELRQGQGTAMGGVAQR
jgi:hypothetical protein